MHHDINIKNMHQKRISKINYSNKHFATKLDDRLTTGHFDVADLLVEGKVVIEHCATQGDDEPGERGNDERERERGREKEIGRKERQRKSGEKEREGGKGKKKKKRQRERER